MPYGVFTWAFTPFSATETTGQFLLAIAVSVALFVGLMALLHRLAPRVKKWMMISLTFIAGLYFTLEFFLPARANQVSGEMENFLTPTITPVSNFIMYTVVWLVGLGIISLALVHGRRLLKAQPGWHNSLIFFLALISSMVVGFMTNGGLRGTDAAQTVYNSLYFGVLVNLDAAMFSLLAFYIASAAYRAFRVRTVEAGLLMGAALIVMLGMVNFGVLMTSWIPLDSPFALLRIEQLSQWLLNWINMPAYRAVVIGVGIGSLAMAMRLWLSLERGTFFSQEG